MIDDGSGGSGVAGGSAGVPGAARGGHGVRGGEAGRRESQTFVGDSLAARYASFVKLPHTLFALPFAGVGVVLASYGHPGRVTPSTVLWILVAFTTARFAAMGFNRIVDRQHDAANPRTRLRELPTGRLTVAQAWAAVVLTSSAFVFAAWQLNVLCGWLSPVALAWVFLYSYTKRFTEAAHLVLGLGLGIAPAGAYLAVTGAWSVPWWGLLALAAAVMFWVAGFDVIYSFQDLDFDRTTGLRSFPARLGLLGAAKAARAFHGLAVIAFAGIWLLDLFPVSWLYLAAIVLMAGLLHYEHALVRHQVRSGVLDLPLVDRAFFRVNVGVSATVFALTLLDRILLA